MGQQMQVKMLSEISALRKGHYRQGLRGARGRVGTTVAHA